MSHLHNSNAGSDPYEGADLFDRIPFDTAARRAKFVLAIWVERLALLVLAIIVLVAIWPYARWLQQSGPAQPAPTWHSGLFRESAQDVWSTAGQAFDYVMTRWGESPILLLIVLIAGLWAIYRILRGVDYIAFGSTAFASPLGGVKLALRKVTASAKRAWSAAGSVNNKRPGIYLTLRGLQIVRVDNDVDNARPDHQSDGLQNTNP